MDISLLFFLLVLKSDKHLLSCPHGLGRGGRESVGVAQEARDHSYFRTPSVVNKVHPDLEVINRDEGVAIPECWQPVLDHATMTSSTYATPRRGTDDGTIDAI